MTIHQLVSRADGSGGFAVVETDNSADLIGTTSKFTPFADYLIYPESTSPMVCGRRRKPSNSGINRLNRDTSRDTSKGRPGGPPSPSRESASLDSPPRFRQPVAGGAAVARRGGAMLRKHRTEQKAEKLRAGDQWTETGLVFTTELGAAVDPRNFLRVIEGAAAAAGAQGVGVHTLRHSAAVSWLEAGVHIKAVADMLGHSSISITGDTSDGTARCGDGGRVLGCERRCDTRCATYPAGMAFGVCAVAVWL